MNILQICYCYPPFFSGYGKQLHTVNKELINNHEEVSITVITAYGNQRVIELNEKLIIKSLFKTSQRRGGVYYYLFCLFALFRSFNYFLKADVIHVVKAGPELIIPTALSKLLGKKVIIKVAQDDLENLLPLKISLLRKIRRYYIRKADVIVALSQKIENEAITLGVSKRSIQRIPNCIDFNRFNYQKLEGSHPYKKRYIFVGAISKRKGILDLLHALEKYQGDLIKFTFIGPLLDIENFDERLDSIDPKYVDISYLGEVDNPEVFLKESDCLVLPSYNEGMPNVVLEAMACGLYVILSNINVHQELTSIAQGACFELGDCNDLDSKIKKFNNLTYDSLDKKEQSLIAEKNYHASYISQLYMYIYGEILTK